MTRTIDAHVHMWPPRRADTVVHAWPGVAEPDDLDARAEALIAQMDAHGVDRAVVVQTPWRFDGDAYLREAQARFPERLSLVGSFPLWLSEADIAYEAGRLGEGRLEGVRLHITGPDALELFAG